MTYNPKTHRRQSIRLKEYDYSQNGAYFMTICVQDKKCIFGKIRDGKMILNTAGKIVEKWWRKLPEYFPNIELDAFIVMPNHVHAIIVINNENGMETETPLVGTQNETGQPQGIAPTNTIGDIAGAFKSLTTNEYINGVKNEKFPSFKKRIWQRNYHEHIIRNEKSWQMIHDYIVLYPETWANDMFFVEQSFISKK
jgi:putative transposase